MHCGFVAQEWRTCRTWVKNLCIYTICQQIRKKGNNLLTTYSLKGPNIVILVICPIWKRAKRFTRFFDLINMGSGMEFLLSPLEILLYHEPIQLVQYEIWIYPSPFVSKMVHMRATPLNFNILKNPVLWTQILILWIALWV